MTNPVLAVLLSRSHSHRASIATSWMVSIPQPSSIDRDSLSTGRCTGPATCLDPTAIEHRSRREDDPKRDPDIAESRSHSHRASIAT